MDVLYQAPDADGIMVALGSADVNKFTPKDFISNFVITNAQNSDCKDPSTSDIISIPNSNAFIDFNGDCVADLLLTR